MNVTFIGQFWISLILAAVLMPLFASADEPVAALSESEIADLFSQGKEFFREANELAVEDADAAQALYQKAALRFERIANQGGIDNGKLYYNIGNTYFRMKDIGRAILNYRRAALYTPNDVNLQQNLAYALQRRQDAIEVEAQKKVLQTLLFWHYDVSTRTRALVFAASFAGAWICAALLLLASRPTLKWLAAIFAIVAMAALASVVVEAADFGKTRVGVIVAESTVARKGDSTSYEPSFQEPLHAGTEFQVFEVRDNWLNIALADGRQCWLPRADIELVEPLG